MMSARAATPRRGGRGGGKRTFADLEKGASRGKSDKVTFPETTEVSEKERKGGSRSWEARGGGWAERWCTSRLEERGGWQIRKARGRLWGRVEGRE